MAKKQEKNKGGRPSVFTEEVLLKLQQAFNIGCNNSEACAYAGISENPFYEYIRNNTEFKEKISQWKMSPILTARNTVVKNLSEDKALAWSYLQKKNHKEFREGVDQTTSIQFGEDEAESAVDNVLDQI